MSLISAAFQPEDHKISKNKIRKVKQKDENIFYFIRKRVEKITLYMYIYNKIKLNMEVNTEDL